MKAVFSPKLKKILPLVFCLSLILTVGLYFTFQKQGLFIDEIYSYGLSNSEYAPFLKDLKGGDVVGQIYTRQDLMDYVAVQEGESFGFFQSVYYNQEQDVHPPLYYFFLHLASLLTPNRLSPWSGLALNYVFFLALLLLLDALGRRLFSHPAARWSTLLCYGLSSLALSALNMIRMYMLLSFFSLLLAYWLVRLDEAEEKNASRRKRWGYLICFGLTLTAGLLTQYYFVFYAFFLCLTYLLRLLLKRQWGRALGFGAVSLGGVGLMVLIFPAVIRHMSSGALVSGNNALGNLTDLGRWPEQLKYYLIGSEVRLWAAVRVALLCLLICLIFFRRLRPNQEENRGLSPLWLALPAGFALIVIAIVSPVQTLRYVWSLAPALALGSGWLLDRALSLLPRTRLEGPAGRLIQLGALALLIVFSGWKLLQFPPDYLYPEMPAMNAALEEEINKGASCLYVTNHYYAPMTQDLAQLALFDEFYVTDTLIRPELSTYLNSRGNPRRLVVFVDTDEFWSSGFHAEHLLEQYLAESDFSQARLLYRFGLSETWVLE